ERDLDHGVLPSEHGRTLVRCALPRRRRRRARLRLGAAARPGGRGGRHGTRLRARLPAAHPLQARAGFRPSLVVRHRTQRGAGRAAAAQADRRADLRPRRRARARRPVRPGPPARAARDGPGRARGARPARARARRPEVPRRAEQRRDRRAARNLGIQRGHEGAPRRHETAEGLRM
ncbi:MAG: hypothetical protein AVDCRST_MAG53-3193, partial [uncultured Solirubrobacteraceae bacterium]